MVPPSEQKTYSSKDLQTESVTAKLDRCSELLEALHTANAQEMEGLVEFRSGFFTSDTRFEFQARQTRAVSPKVPILFGEILHHLRSSLDHLVWEAVLRNGGEPGRHNQFPIFSEQRRYNEKSRRYLRGTSIGFQNCVTEMQPFNVKEGGQSMLTVIQDLNNMDKHRLLPVVSASTAIASEFRIRPGISGKVTSFHIPGVVSLEQEWLMYAGLDLSDPDPGFSGEMPQNTILTIEGTPPVPLTTVAYDLCKNTLMAAWQLEQSFH